MKKQSNLPRFLVAISFLLSGCAGQVATHEEATRSIKESPRAQEIASQEWAAAASGGMVDDIWLKSFGDPELMNLVQEAQQNNFGLKISAARVEQAEALARKAGASLKPTVGLSGGYSDRNNEDRGELYGGGLRISWEADVWGRIRSGVAGETELAEASRSDFEFARQSLAAATANGYFLTTGSSVLYGYADEVVGILEETLRIAEVQEKVGKGSMKDVHLARADLASAQEARRQAKAADESARRSLELLLGRYPSGSITTKTTIAAVPPPVAAGMPSELLERRPDIIASEQRVAAAFYKTREAELMHLPSFSFSLGVGAFNLTDAVTNLAAGLFAPLYTGGAIEAEVEGANAAQKESIAAYADTAIRAFKEVETALANEEHLLKRQEYLDAAVEENYAAYNLMKKQYEVGKTDLLAVLVVQNKWVQARIAAADVATRRLINRVGLHLALGGSFE